MPRDASRLMVLRGGAVEHRTFSELPEYMREGDVLVLNETRVIAARIAGKRPTGGRVELLLLRPSLGRYDPAARRWQVLAKPGRRLGVGARIGFGELGEAVVVAVNEREGVREVEFMLQLPFESFLEQAGTLPLPPYISNDTREAQERYQTIFAHEPGSVAAPTASLHFTEAVFAKLRERGVEIVKLVLDVGLGTFRPMQGRTLGEHRMHGESFNIPQAVVDAITRAQSERRRVIAAGTTVTRALEGSVANHGRLRAGADETDLFIKPGFRFGVVDALLTNFHLPQSTLLVLVSAFAGRERMMRAYEMAVERNYRFFSFGDAMFIEREGA